MLHIQVPRPVRTLRQYQFHYRVETRQASEHSNADAAVAKSFGFRALNFEIRHSELWDSFYPLSFLTRNGGPLFKSRHDRAAITFEYPVHEPVAAFFIERAKNFGYDVEVASDVYCKAMDLPTSGCGLSFGGGKDSRLLLGILQELGRKPTVYSSGKDCAPDIDGAQISESVSFKLMDRIMPTLMSLPRTLFHGSGLGEVALNQPWQQYYDWSSRHALRQMSLLLRSLGVEMDLLPPASVLPYNLIQGILHDRYPDLYAHQKSVEAEEWSDKNLHVALLKLYWGLDFSSHCSNELFASMAWYFVKDQVAHPEKFGFRAHREVINREMRAIIFEMKDHHLLRSVCGSIPDCWEGDWINSVHRYVYPDIDPEYMSIFSEYAPVVTSKNNLSYSVAAAPQ